MICYNFKIVDTAQVLLNNLVHTAVLIVTHMNYKKTSC
jgi:hypothetical protein